MSSPSSVSSGGVKSVVKPSATSDTPPTRTPQAPRATSPGDSIGSTTNNECCFVKIWNAICNFFKSICSCLFGPSKQETNREGTKPLDRNATMQKGNEFMESYSTFFKGKTKHKIAVEAFKTLQPEVQWHVLYLMVRGDKMRLGHIRTYVQGNEQIASEVCNELGLNNIKDLLETSGDLRERLRDFLQSKEGIRPLPATPSTQPTTSSTKRQPIEELDPEETLKEAQKPLKRKEEQKPFDGPISAEPPKAVSEWLKSNATLPQLDWFSSNACDNTGRVQILLHLAKTESDMFRVVLYLNEWTRENQPQKELLKKVLGVSVIGLTTEKQRPQLIAFLEAELWRIHQPEG